MPICSFHVYMTIGLPMSTKLCFSCIFESLYFTRMAKPRHCLAQTTRKHAILRVKKSLYLFCMQKPCIATSHDTLRTNGTRSIHVRPYEFDLQDYHLQSKSLEPYTCFAHLHPWYKCAIFIYSHTPYKTKTQPNSIFKKRQHLHHNKVALPFFLKVLTF